MANNLLFVGSVPFDTAEEVLGTLGQRFGAQVPALPDGEVGERRSWVNRFGYQLFNGHLNLDTTQRPRSDDGVERLLPHDRSDAWQFKVKPGVDRVRFGAPGQRLGYARDATASYFVFKTLREKGLIPPGVRFQISIPMVNSVVRALYFPEPSDLGRVRPGFETALAAELEVIFQRIPHEDLAVQWDCAWEVAAVHEGDVVAGPAEREIATHTAPIERLSKILPPGVALGFHFCFGTFGGWPRFAPPDLGRTVELVNAAIIAAGRQVDWVHIPALDRTDDAFYAPLDALDPRGARVFMGMIHSMPSFAQRLELVRRHLPEFGIAAYCGFGRVPTEQIPQVLDDHQRALEIAGFA